MWLNFLKCEDTIKCAVVGREGINEISGRLTNVFLNYISNREIGTQIFNYQSE